MPEYDCEMDKNLGYIIPTLPTEIDSPWACNNCNNEVRSLAMIHALDDVDTRVWRFKDQVLQGLKGEDQKIIALRNEIAELEAKLHPNNFHVWKLKQLLFNLLTECILLMMPPGSWKEFRDIYREIDALANFIMRTVMIQQPGYSLIRGESCVLNLNGKFAIFFKFDVYFLQDEACTIWWQRIGAIFNGQWFMERQALSKLTIPPGIFSNLQRKRLKFSNRKLRKLGRLLIQ